MSRGKKIDTWVFSHDGLEIKVPLMMHKGRYDITFEAKIEAFDLHLMNSDAGKLKEELYREFVKRARVEWKDYLRVCVGGRADRLTNTSFRDEPFLRDDIKCYLKLFVERLQVGIDNNGDPVHRPNHERGTSQRINKGMPTVGPVDSHWWHYDADGDGIAALIPDTPENRAAIDAISDAMEKLADQLKVLLGQDQIDQTLLAIGSRRLKLLTTSISKTEELD